MDDAMINVITIIQSKKSSI